MWTAITTMATTRIRSRTIRSPVIMSVVLCVFPWTSGCIGAMKSCTHWEDVCPQTLSRPPHPDDEEGTGTLHKEVDPVLLEDPDFQKLHQQFRTKIDLGIELLEAAIQHKVPFSVLLFDSWYLAEELVSMARYRKKDWISLLKKNRNLETNSFVLKDAAGKPIPLEGPHIAVEDLVPLIPPTAYRAVTVGDKTYWTFTLAVRLPGLGKVRLVVSFKKRGVDGHVCRVGDAIGWTGVRNGSSPCICNAGRLKPFIRTVKAIWAWTSIACATLKPLGNIGVWCSWRIRSCIWIVFPRHRQKAACPSKPLGKRVVSKPKHSCRR